MSIDYPAVLADLEERIAKLTVAADAIREIVGATEKPVRQNGVTGDAPILATKRAPAAKRPRAGTVATMAFEIIRQHGGPMKVSEIAKMLQAMGRFRTDDARSNYGTVYGTLKNDQRFVKVGEGEFEIRERSKVQGLPSREMAVTLGMPGAD